MFLVLEPESKMKGIGRLVSWGTLPTIDNIKRNLDNPDFLTITWRKVDDKEPWVLNILLPNNANDCASLILKHLKKWITNSIDQASFALIYSTKDG